MVIRMRAKWAWLLVGSASLLSAVATARASTPGSLPPLRADWPLEELPVAGFGDAVVSIPIGATAARPVVVAIHGHRHRPDWQCGLARELVGERAFVVCPRGVLAPRHRGDGDEERYTFRTADDTAREVDAALAALTAAYPGYVDARRPALYGHSLGATFGAAILRRDPTRWSRAIFSEGGYEGWAAGSSRAFVAAGSARVLFGCGTLGCSATAGQAARLLEHYGAGARVAYARGGGHHSWGPIIDAMSADVDWLLEGDVRFDP
jgi:pimeloyl-ACP methyl ester carboxylesterase